MINILERAKELRRKSITKGEILQSNLWVIKKTEMKIRVKSELKFLERFNEHCDGCDGLCDTCESFLQDRIKELKEALRILK